MREFVAANPDFAITLFVWLFGLLVLVVGVTTYLYQRLQNKEETIADRTAEVLAQALQRVERSFIEAAAEFRAYMSQTNDRLGQTNDRLLRLETEHKFFSGTGVPHRRWDDDEEPPAGLHR